MTFAITKPNFNNEDYRMIDPRFLPYLDDWKVIQNYKGNEYILVGI